MVLAKGSTPQYGRRPLRCGILTRLMTAVGQSRQIDRPTTLVSCPLRADRVRNSAPQRIEALCPILLRKSLMVSRNGDSVVVKRFAVEASDDGAAQSRSRAVVLFISA